MNLGNIFLYTSIAASLAAVLFYLKSGGSKESELNLSRKLYYGSSLFILLAVILLFFAFLNNDFRYSYVYSYSNSELEWYYLISAFWAGQPGSFLLWLFILNIFGLLVIRKHDKEEHILMSVIILTQAAILILLSIDSPFKFIWDQYANLKQGEFPRDGSGLNPLLIDPWMIVHPPVLFLGYASATVPFAYVIDALIKKDYTSWIERSYNWVMFSFISLGIGIFLGGYWAYKVLGWGGYWGWDPVENSSLIPWLIGLILFHSMLLYRRKKVLARTAIFSALSYMIFVFYGTYLTRSGILKDFSVHSFGDSVIGAFLGGFILICIAVSSFLFIKRFKDMKSLSKPVDQNLFSWDTLLVYGLITLGVYAFLILIGTSMPIITGIILPKATVVTEKFYNSISIPFGILLLVLMVLSTMAVVSKKLIVIKDFVAMGAAIIMAVFFNLMFTEKAEAYVLTAVSLFVVLEYIYDFTKLKLSAILPSRLAHIGLGLMVVGVVTSGFHSTTDQKKLLLNTPGTVGGVNLTFNGFTQEKEASMVFTVRESDNARRIAMKYFMSEKMNSLYREPHIDYGFFGDTYIIPEEYTQSSVADNNVVLAKGQQQNIGGVNVKFLKFDARQMRAAEPVIYAELLVNGKRVKPGIKIDQRDSNRIDAKVPGTDRSITLLRINPSDELINIFVSPGKDVTVVPDSVIVKVSHKRLIWIVWLGTVLITVGSCFAIYYHRPASASTEA
jgi:cytochrome c-type biogenesis protein CcmF